MSSLRGVCAIVAAMLVAASVPARAACDAGGPDAAAVTAARDAIDSGCPCAAALTRSTYRRCATDVVRGLVLAAQLETRCRREALKHAKLSTCGRPGAAVCCRVRPDGRTRHRVVSEAAKCVSTPTITACVSERQSVPTGCDASGCVVVPVCGNGVVETGETCDPPDLGELTCSATCQTVGCETAPAGCGNGVVDAGEACDPPGVGDCGRHCQLATCTPAGAGEIGVACADTTTSVGAGARSDGYLLAWSARHHRTGRDLLARRFDADGLATDAGATIVSDEAPCAGGHSGPAVASDGADYYVVWQEGGGLGDSSAFYEAMNGRRVGGVAGTDPRRQFVFNIPFGTCRTGVFGPTMAAGESSGRFAAGWNFGGGCFGSLIFQNPTGLIVDLNPSPVSTPVGLGYGQPTAPPTIASQSAGAVASLATDTLWVWNAIVAPSSDPATHERFVAAVWTAPGGSTLPFRLTGRTAAATRRPAVAAGATSFLVAWADAGQIRAVRATRAANAIDPDGGIPLVGGVGSVTGGPIAAFDGTRWLVVWAETSGGTNDLRAVAVEPDGTPVDATPRLLATNVTAQDPAAASTGDGRVLVLYARPDGANHAVRAALVTP